MASSESTDGLSTKRTANFMQVLFQLQVQLCGAICLFCVGCTWKTLVYCGFLILLGGLGQTAGAHRLWAHGSYKANAALRTFLMICQTTVGFGTIYEWVRWHRLHHKHFRTDLDPYNSTKGFLYVHIFSSTLDFSPAQEKALQEIDMTDLEEDKIVMFQRKWYTFLYIIFVMILPINAPAEYWGESLLSSFLVVGLLKYTLVLQLVLLIHSAPVIWDVKFGEKFLVNSNWVFLFTKTYWLSYHYLVPRDYQTGEYGSYGDDLVSKFIRVCAALEFASDLKTIDSGVVRQALAVSVAEKKDITQCLAELSEKDDSLSKEHYLNPKAHY